MNIVMVGARAFPVIKAAVAVCDLLATFDRDADVIHTREKGTDAFISEAAGVMGFQIKRWPAEGGASNYIRDVEMVKAADAVYAFFEADHVGEGGTQHVVDKSLDQSKRTLSYTWTNRDGLVLVGSSDGGEGLTGDNEETTAGSAQGVGEAASERTRRRSQSPEDRGPSWAVGKSGEGHAGAHSQD